MTELFCKILISCIDCGHLTEIYGPFKTQKEAEAFEDYVDESIAGMTCVGSGKVVKLNSERVKLRYD